MFAVRVRVFSSGLFVFYNCGPEVRPSNFNLVAISTPTSLVSPLQLSCLTTMSPTVVSAPGKVLLAGGYLILDPKYSGIVVSTSSRFYSIVSPVSTPGVITVNSPQFINAVWKYSVRPNGMIEAEYVTKGTGHRFTVRLIGPLQPVDHRREQIRASRVKKYLDSCRRVERPRGHRCSVAERPPDPYTWRQRFLFTEDHGTAMASAGPR